MTVKSLNDKRNTIMNKLLYDKSSYCIMMILKDNSNFFREIQNSIDAEAIYYGDDPQRTFGIEHERHCTLFFAFDTTHQKEDVQSLHQRIEDITLPNINDINLLKFEVFEASDYDVIVAKIKNETFSAINKIYVDSFDKVGVTPTFSEYKPHVTVGYVKKGLGKKYVDIFNNLLLLTDANVTFDSTILKIVSKNFMNGGSLSSTGLFPLINK